MEELKKYICKLPPDTFPDKVILSVICGHASKLPVVCVFEVRGCRKLLANIHKYDGSGELVDEAKWIKDLYFSYTCSAIVLDSNIALADELVKCQSENYPSFGVQNDREGRWENQYDSVRFLKDVLFLVHNTSLLLHMMAIVLSSELEKGNVWMLSEDDVEQLNDKNGAARAFLQGVWWLYNSGLSDGGDAG